jgi:uncharacterized protein DUF6125
MKPVNSIDDLSKEELRELLEIYAKNWLAHDGCWFLAIEEAHNMDLAIDMDREAWRKFTIVEAKKIIKFLELGENSGLDGLAKALRFRLYSSINTDRIERVDENNLMYFVTSCRVQVARRRKNLPDFPCKSVGIVEYSGFATTIDTRIETKCISCAPEVTNDEHYCIWKFTMNPNNEEDN